MKFKDAQKKAMDKFIDPAFRARIKEEDPSMVRHLPTLRAMNERGFLTLNSQAGNRTKTERYDIWERAYVEGFMAFEHATEFLKRMALLTDKNAIFVPTCPNDVILPSALDIPLTVTHKEGAVKINTHMSTALPKAVMNSYMKQAGLTVGSHAVYIFCWDTRWNRAGLFQDILKAL